jgi:hypothetical protein
VFSTLLVCHGSDWDRGNGVKQGEYAIEPAYFGITYPQVFLHWPNNNSHYLTINKGDQ